MGADSARVATLTWGSPARGTVRRKNKAAAIAVVLAAAALLYDAIDAHVKETYAIPAELVEPSNALAARFYGHAAAGGGNVVFSPVGMYVALMALYEGAGGETAEQIEGALGIDPDKARRRGDVSRTLEYLDRGHGHSYVRIASALWAVPWIEPQEEYLSVMRDVYRVEVVAGSADPDRAMGEMSSWVAGKTNHKITGAIAQDSGVAASPIAVTGTAYFRDTWPDRDPARATVEADIHAGGPEPASAEFLRVSGTLGYAEVDGMQVLQVPSDSGRISLVIMLPGSQGGLGGLEEGIAAGRTGEWIGAMQPTEVDALIPEFSVHSTHDMDGALREMGVTHVFDPAAADLAGIAGPAGAPLHVGHASHNAFAEIAKHRAGNRTAGAAGEDPVPEPVRVTVGVPFAFAVTDDRSGLILLMGRLADPPAPRLT